MSADKVNILIVDDLPEKLLVLDTVLADLDENVIVARSGEEALRRILDNEFAVILLDVNMPGMDGFETAALIRKRRRSAHVPIIFLTAFADEMHTAQGYSLGAVDYIFSPVVPEVLRTKVKVFVELFRMTEQVKRQADERVVLAREQAARAAAEEATRRSTFLSEASKVLASSLEYEATLRGLLRFAIPDLGDLSALTLVDEHGNMGPTELAWTDPAHGTRSGAVTSSEELDAKMAGALRRGILLGKSQYLPRMGSSNEVRTTCARADEPFPDFALGSVVLVPLLARGRVLGALTLAMGPSGRRHTPADLDLAEELAGRAAIAIDNARLYREVQEGDRRKNEFLSMLAHELRNPLAPIRNAVQILRLRGSTDPAIQPIQDMIDRQVQQLVRIVDDLLDISRITRGKIRLQKEPVEVAQVVARAVETARPLLESRRHELTVSLPAPPLRVEADAIRLAQVLGNLLTNAAKYTAEGGHIWLTAERDGHEAVLRVRDTGVGIPQHMLASIFDLFTQVEHSLDRSQGGLGIGLTLVRRLVEMHDGKVQATSAGPDQGSEFVVRLPALSAERAPVRPTRGLPKSLATGVRTQVLVVDDNVDGAESLAMLLRLAGHEVRVAHDGPEGLAAALDFQPDLVLLDIGLPQMDGYEVARRLRKHPDLKDVLLVALTGYGQESDIRRSREAGFDHHLVKPADPAALAALFASLTNAARACV